MNPRRLLELPSAPTVALLAAAPVALLIGRSASNDPELTIAVVVGLLLAALAFFASLTVSLVVFTLLTFFEHLPTFGPDVTAVKFIGAVMTLSWLARAIDQRSGIPLVFLDRPLLSFVIAAFVVLALVSAAWATDVGATLAATLRLFQVVLLLFVTYSAIREPKHLRWMMWAFCSGVFLTAGYGLSQGLSSGPDRLIGGILDPNFLAASLVTATVFAVFLLASGPTPRNRTILVGFLLVYLPSFFFTQSRGGLVAMATAFLVAAFLAGPVRARVIAVVLVISAVAVTYYAVVAPAATRERIASISAEGSAGRVDEWRVALRMTADHPVIGVGLDNFRAVEPGYITSTVQFFDIRALLRNSQTHNTYLQTLSELGILGASLLAALLAGVVVGGARAARALAAQGRQPVEIAARGIVIGTVALLAAYFFLPGLYEKQLWLLLGLAAALANIARPASTRAAA